MPSNWLPELVPFFNPWSDYCDAVHGYFHADFVDTKPAFRGQPVQILVEPRLQGKEYTFWHLISERPLGASERVPDFRRCERIRWPKALLEVAEGERRVWQEPQRGRLPSLGVALPDFSYVLFLRQWPANYELATAYVVTSANRRTKYRREWEVEPR